MATSKYGKGYRKDHRKRKTHTKSRFWNKTTIARGMSLIAPDLMRVKLPFFANVAFQTSATPANVSTPIRMVLNDILTPVVGLTPSPRGLDEWFTFYDWVCVKSVRLTVQFKNVETLSSAQNGTVYVLIDNDASQTHLTSNKDVMENPHTKWRSFQTAVKYPQITINVPISKYTGITTTINDNSCNAAHTQVPVSGYRVLAKIGGTNFSAQINIEAHIHAIYDCVFRKMTIPAASP